RAFRQAAGRGLQHGDGRDAARDADDRLGRQARSAQGAHRPARPRRLGATVRSAGQAFRCGNPRRRNGRAQRPGAACPCAAARAPIWRQARRNRGRLHPAHAGGWRRREPRHRDLRDFAFAESAREGAQGAGDRALPAQPQPRAAAEQAADHVGSARIGSDRAGRGRDPVHLPRRGLQRGVAGQGRGRDHHRQAAQRSHRHRSARFSRTVHTLRESRAAGQILVSGGSSVASRSERVLVTGARGFTGRYLVDRLRADGYSVVGMTEALPAGASEVHANLLDPGAMARAVELARPDRVVHLAALSFVAHDDVEATYRVNLLGSLALLQALDAMSTPIRSVILASSAAVYGNVNADAIEETAAPAPVSHYGASKRAMELVAATFRDRLPIVVVRPFNYTGPGQAEHFAVPKVV